MRVSCLILTFNEEVNIEPCLKSLSWCDDIVVLDSGSTDQTLAIATRHGARILQRPFDDFASQRNFGLEQGQFRHEWVLHLDADEVATPEFVTALQALVPAEGISAYRVPSKTMFFGRWLKHAGMYPVYQVRLGQRDHLRFVQVGHGQREDLPVQSVAVFDEPYLHYSFSHGLFAWLNKHVRYARDEAALVIAVREGTNERVDGTDATSRRRSIKAKVAHLPVTLRPFARFLYVYFLKLGFRDGSAGFIYAFMLSIYEGMIAILVIEATLQKKLRATDRN